MTLKKHIKIQNQPETKSFLSLDLVFKAISR